MGTKVADVMTQRPRAVAPQTPLTEVAKVMEAEDVGAVPLVEGDRLVGIVTDRDIVVRAIAKGKDPRGMPASEVSSRELLTVSPDDDLSEALKVMAQYQVRRLAVTAESREATERALAAHPLGCLAHQSVKDAIGITWSATLKAADQLLSLKEEGSASA